MIKVRNMHSRTGCANDRHYYSWSHDRNDARTGSDSRTRKRAAGKSKTSRRPKTASAVLQAQIEKVRPQLQQIFEASDQLFAKIRSTL